MSPFHWYLGLYKFNYFHLVAKKVHEKSTFPQIFSSVVILDFVFGKCFNPKLNSFLIENLFDAIFQYSQLLETLGSGMNLEFHLDILPNLLNESRCACETSRGEQIQLYTNYQKLQLCVDFFILFQIKLKYFHGSFFVKLFVYNQNWDFICFQLFLGDDCGVRWCLWEDSLESWQKKSFRSLQKKLKRVALDSLFVNSKSSTTLRAPPFFQHTK